MPPFADWPQNGNIDLSIQDLPHRNVSIEWWYLNCHLTTINHRQISIFASFFKFLKSYDEATNTPQYLYYLLWSLSDINQQKYYPDSRMDKSIPEVSLELLKTEAIQESKLRAALEEIYAKGKIPLPERLFKGEVKICEDKLYLDFDGATLFKQEDKTYKLHLYNEYNKTGCDLIFEPRKPPALHGDQGLVSGLHSDEDTFYYFIPSCKVTGEITIEGERLALTQGQGWYDHQFGGEKILAKHKFVAGWNWVAIQLDNDFELSAAYMIDIETGIPHLKFAVLIDPRGHQTTYKEFYFEPIKNPETLWRSYITFNEYPTEWIFKIHEIKLELHIKACFPAQEFITFVIPGLAFWEGCCEVQGLFANETVRGKAYIERQGFHTIKNVDDFFSSVGKEVFKQIKNLIPLHPTLKQWQDIISLHADKNLLENVDFETLAEILIKPIREITDRTGKAWRPYIILACCNAVGGNFEKYLPLLTFELVHVGSLIIDDVEDHSQIRRGGPADHLIYGEALAINAGTLAYFLPQALFKHVLKDQPLLQLEFDEIYFEALRASHAGQAFDVAGLDELVTKIIAGELEPTALEQRILTIHRLKSGAPVAALARLGCMLGNGTKEQIDGLYDYLKALGIAFQIIDDVLNLRGFKGDLKPKGEDIIAGKITFPIAKAWNLLTPDEYHKLLKAVLNKPKNPQDIIDILDRCGALQVATTHAETMIEEAWQQLDPFLEDSFSKIMLRVFGKYIIERFY